MARERSGIYGYLSLACALLQVLTLHRVYGQSTAGQACLPLDVVLVLPTSSTPQNFQNLKSFLQGTLSQINIGGAASTVQIGVVKYRGTAQIELSLGQYSTSSDILNAISNMAAVTVTGNNVASALNLTSQVFIGGGVRTTVPYVAIIFEDGTSDNLAATTAAVTTLNNYGVTIMAVSIGSTDSLSPLVTSGNYLLSAPDYNSLASQQGTFVSTLCSITKKLCPKEADIALVLDQSSSIAQPPGGYNNWYVSILNFVGNISVGFPVGPQLTQFGLVKFSDVATVSWYLNTYSNNNDLLAAVQQLKILGGETNLADALRIGLDVRALMRTAGAGFLWPDALPDTNKILHGVARTQILFNSPGSRVGVKKIIILITDGAANRDTQDTYSEDNITKSMGVEIFCIGMTSQIDVQQLQTLSSAPYSTHFFYASDYSTVSTVLSQLYTSTCAQPIYTSSTGAATTTTPTTTTSTTTTPTTTTSTTTTPTTTTSTTTTPTTTTSTTTTSTTTTPTTTTSTTTTPTTTTSTTTTPTTTTSTTTTPTTTTPTTTIPTTTLFPPIQCTQVVDVVFVIDTSGSLDPNYFQSILSFVIGVSRYFPIQTGSIQVGLMTFGSTQKLDVQLSTFKSFGALVDAIEQAQYFGTSSAKGSAFDYLVNTVFTPADGARLDTPSLCVFITNSRSPDQAAALAGADLARRSGITIMTVALGTWLDIDEIYAIGTYPASYFSFQTAMNNLSSIQQQVASLICSNQDPCSSNPCLNGGLCTSLFGYFQCACKLGYGGHQCNNVCKGVGDIVFAVDSSGSIGLVNWRLDIDFITSVVQNLDIDSALPAGSTTGSRVGLIIYNDAVNIVFQLNTYTSKNNLLQGIQQLYMTGSTNTAQAIQMANDIMFTTANGDRPSVQNYLVVITDGMSNNKTATIMEAMRARDNGIEIIAVGVGDYNYVELQAIASAPMTSNVLTSANYSTLGPDLETKLESLLCSSQDYCTPNPCQNGATCTNILGWYSCAPCPAPYTGPTCQRSCSGVLDLVFVLDASGSINYDRFPLLLSFVQNIVLQLEVSANKTRVGLVYFSNTPYLGFSLNRYWNQQDIIQRHNVANLMQGVGMIPYLGLFTDLGAALTYLTNNMFLPANGGRPSAVHMAVFVTDAVSTIDGSDTVPAGIAAKIAGIQVVTVVVGQPAYVDFSNAANIASDPASRNVINVTSYYSLANVTNRIVAATCNDMNECMSGPCMAGGTCVDGFGLYNCICPMSATGFNCQMTCSKQMNLIFVLDLSDGDVYYDMIVALVKQIIYGVDVTNDQVRVGVVTYASTVGDTFYLNQYTRNRQDLIYAIDFNAKGGSANTQAALQFVLSNELSPANGALPSTPDVVIVITDGNSDVLQGSPGANGAKALLQAGATIYAVGYGPSPNQGELSAIAGSNSAKQKTFMIASASMTDVATTATAVLQQLCS